MKKSNKYINSIDGLRAIAVMAVVFFHAGFSQFSGGFVGVDVFFVISGFLITLHIIEQKEAGIFSFGKFYQRRIARLLPAAATVFFATLVAGYFILSPEDLKRVGQSAIYVSLSVSNIFFWSEAGYFDQVSGLKPFLHTWSLSVEEQFYLVWPSLVIGLFFLGKRKAVIIGMIVLSLAALIASLYVAKDNPDKVFFLTPFRVYQFGIGALIALVGFHAPKTYKAYLLLISVAGLVILIFSVNDHSHVLYASILPAILAGGFIIGSQTAIAEKIFASPVFVWIGQRSYSIYLVHWPLMVLWKINTDYEFSRIEKVLAVGLSILLGYILHAVVEKRFRFSSGMNAEYRQRIVSFTLMFLVINITVASHYWGKQGYPDRVSDDLKRYAVGVNQKWKERIKLLRYGTCNLQAKKYKYKDFDQKKCLSVDHTKPNWLILGDSYASGAYAIFVKAYPNVHFSQLTIPGYRLRPLKRIKTNTVEDQLLKTAYQFIQQNDQLEGVVISSNWLAGHIYEIEEIVAELKASGKKVVLINQRIKFKDRVPAIIASSMSRDGAIKRANQLLVADKFKIAEHIQSRLKAKVPIINMIDLQCPNAGRCDIFDAQGSMLYLDGAHFSVAGLDLIRQRMLEKYANILK